MALRSFRVGVALRVCAIALLVFVGLWGWMAADWLVTPAVSGVLALLAVVELIRYVEKTGRDLSSFLSFVASHDFSIPPTTPHKGRVFQELDSAYRQLAGELRRLNLQKAANHQYLEAVVEHVGVALVCLDQDGQVVMTNGTARRLFGLPHLGSLQPLARVDQRLPDLLRGLADGERTLLTIARDGDPLQLVLYATLFELLDQRYTLVSFQDIRSELDRQEMDSWQKLIRVLTHEIMNSVTPITALSHVVRDTLFTSRDGSPALRPLSASDQEDLFRSISAIQTRSSGLLDFVQAYRSFATLPAPAFEEVSVLRLFERVRTLMAGQIEATGITLGVGCDEAGLAVHADSRQMEQVLINLVRNATDALADHPEGRINLHARLDRNGKVEIHVADNGPGVDPEHLENIFVPFFTTRRNGTGVGLSISRQIVHANRGIIAVKSTPGEGCVFTLRLNPWRGVTSRA